MKNKELHREDIHIFSRHSDLSELVVKESLLQNVYNDKEAWHKFLKLFIISLGIGFTVSGIIFFFAYNWDDLHKFTKLGLTQGILLVATLVALLPKLSDTTKNILLTGATVLIGVLFAVYGQIYQTGANAYDFFLVWTIFATIWVFVANFAPLWFIYLLLINTTFFLYTEQVARGWSGSLIFLVLFLINLVALLCMHFLNKQKSPQWFLNTLGIATAFFATVGIVYGIFEERDQYFSLLLLITTATYAVGIWYSLKNKSSFYLAVIPFSLIVIGSAILIKISHGEMMYLFVSLFIIAGITATIKYLLDTNKKWANEK